MGLGLGTGILSTVKVGFPLPPKLGFSLLLVFFHLTLNLPPVTLDSGLAFNHDPELFRTPIGAAHTGEAIALSLTDLKGLGS